MQKLPHHYATTAVGQPEGEITVASPDLEDLRTQSPPEFGGPSGYWSPETLLVGAVGDCFILTWRAIANHNKVEWSDMTVSTTGVLDRVNRVTKFTKIDLHVKLTVPSGTNTETAEKLLHKAEAGCLITNSMTAEVSLDTEIVEC